jgi:hypothetical protein
MGTRHSTNIVLLTDHIEESRQRYHSVVLQNQIVQAPSQEHRSAWICRDLDEVTVMPETLIRAHLKTPSAAAIAGLLFSLLLIVSYWLLRISVPADPQEPGSWLRASSNTVGIAMNLIPFAGIAFLWFIGVLRDRLGQMEDRFFATVFFGSGLLFLGMLFLASAVAGGILTAFVSQPEELIGSATFHFARATVYAIANIYMVKMASVFMITTSTIALYTAIMPRWLAILGYVLALLLLFGSDYVSWSFLVFPVWVLLISICILLDNLRHPNAAIPAEGN